MLKALALIVLLAVSYSAPVEDLVESLPEINDGKPFPFKMYSGYLDIPGTEKHLHYMYVESQ